MRSFGGIVVGVVTGWRPGRLARLSYLVPVDRLPELREAVVEAEKRAVLDRRLTDAHYHAAGMERPAALRTPFDDDED